MFRSIRNSQDMEFSYQARDNEGNLRSGSVEAQNEASAAEALAAHGLIVIKVLPLHKIGILDKLSILNRVSSKELVLFSRQFATLIDAKVPIVQALNILKSQISSQTLKIVITDMASRVESGDSLSSALSRHPKVFSNLYIN